MPINEINVRKMREVRRYPSEVRRFFLLLMGGYWVITQILDWLHPTRSCQSLFARLVNHLVVLLLLLLLPLTSGHERASTAAQLQPPTCRGPQAPDYSQRGVTGEARRGSCALGLSRCTTAHKK